MQTVTRDQLGKGFRDEFLNERIRSRVRIASDLKGRRRHEIA